MTTLTKPTNDALLELAVRAENRSAPGPGWLRALRDEALDRFRELGLPSTRHEDWRFTSLKPVQELDFSAPPAGAPMLPADQLDRFGFAGLDAPRAVFIDGRFSPAHSNLAALPSAVRGLTLEDALAADEETVRAHLDALPKTDPGDAFTALNTAMLDEAMVILIDDGAIIDQPLHILHLTTATQPVATHPRLLVVAGRSSEATIIEDYVGAGDGTYLTNAVSEVFVGVDAAVTHYMIERESPRAFNISTLHVRQERDSRFESHSVLIGGALVRNNVNPVLVGENCHSLLNGLYVGRNGQHLDNFMRVEHDAPHCDSRQYYRGILADQAHGVFSGRIVVARGAQKTDAVQSNESLLLSDDARANGKPQLEIYADDVKCTHGATTGQLDEDAVFYLRSRGLSAEAARGMLIYSFALESLQRMGVAPVRDVLTDALLRRMPFTESLRPYLGSDGGSLPEDIAAGSEE
ncbi:MAG: Fe-S cluster assembly protein SufD [Planctomycetota bacterium]|nr:Fe-S cluster assembly protein SufD [Planctomycetota bacterium]